MVGDMIVWGKTQLNYSSCLSETSRKVSYVQPPAMFWKLKLWYCIVEGVMGPWYPVLIRSGFSSFCKYKVDFLCLTSTNSAQWAYAGTCWDTHISIIFTLLITELDSFEKMQWKVVFTSLSKDLVVSRRY